MKLPTDSYHGVVIFHRLGPYHFSRLRTTGQISRITALEVSQEDDTYAWDKIEGSEGFARVTLFKDKDSRQYSTSQVRTRVRENLQRLRPSFVAVPGWADLAAVAALEWCAQSAVPAVVMTETTPWDDRRNPCKEWIKRRLLNSASAFLAGGKPHADYLMQLGISENRIFLGYDAVDNRHFESMAGKAHHGTAETAVRWALPSRFFLASARFVDKKNLPKLIQAYAQYWQLARKSEAASHRGEPWSLVLLGDGPLKKFIYRTISDLGVKDYVHLPGFVQYNALPNYYGKASCFVHASTVEQWGLVVNEAMASGLPVLVSNRCGCAQDLVKEGINGFTFDPFNTGQLAQLMLRISSRSACRPAAEDPGKILNEKRLAVDLIAMGAASKKIIADWGPDRFATGLLQAAEFAKKAPIKKLTLMDFLIFKLALQRHP